MAKFCGKCGAKLDEATGLCPKCDVEKLAKLSSESLKEKEKQEVSAESEKPLSKKDIRRKKKADKKASRKARKKEKRSGWSTGKKVRYFFLKFVLVVLLLGALGAGVTGALVYFNVVDIPAVESILGKLGLSPNEIEISNLYKNYSEINNQAIEIEKKYSINGSVSKEQLPPLLKELSVLAEQYKEQGIIERYDIEETSIFMKFKSGVGYLYEPTNKEIMSGDQVGSILTVEPYATSKEFLAQYILGGKSPDKAAKKIADSLPELYSFDNNHNQDKFLIEDVERLGKNKIIIWYGHGGYIKEYGSVLGTSVSNKDKASLSIYKEELSNGEMVLGKDCFCLCPLYLDKHIPDNSLKDSMVYLAACESGRDNRLAEVFLRKGARLVVGNTRSIFTRYNLYMMYDFMSGLTNTHEDTTYWTAEDALKYAKEQNGETDGKVIFYGAEVRLIYPDNESEYRLKPVVPDDFEHNQIFNKKIPVEAVKYNGHYYYVYDVDTVTDWSAAQEYCEAKGGYLSTITSQEENDFLYNYIHQCGYESAYFGLTDEGSEGTWSWCNGEPLSYVNWADGEPNNENDSENYGMLYWKYTDGAWNDGDFGHMTDSGGTAFICEWGEYSSDPGGQKMKNIGAQEIHDNDQLATTGILTERMYEINSQNKGKAFILQLDTPSNALLYSTDLGYDGDQENVTEIQINFLPNVTAEDYLNQRVTVKGTVMFGHTGHHLTTVILMDAEILETMPVRTTSDERDIVLVLDVSGSMSGTPIAETQKASTKFVNTILDEDASVGVVTYDNSAYVLSDFSVSKDSLTSVLSDIYSGGGTNIESGLSEARRMLSTSGAKKKIIVLMSDGEPNDGKEGDSLIDYADEIKNDGIIIYTLGFFESLGSYKSSAQILMEDIASDGCHYEVASADDLVFFFEDMADQINGQKYIYIRIACPVDVSVTYNEETLCSDEDELRLRTDFGTLTFEKNEDETDNDDRIKVLRLKEGVDYDVEIVGTGHGIMDYTIGFMDENGDYSDFRRFENIKITRRTKIDTVASVSDESVLKIDEDGDGKYDLKLRATENGYGEEVDNSIVLYVIAGGSAVLLLLIIILVSKKKHRNKKMKEKN